VNPPPGVSQPDPTNMSICHYIPGRGPLEKVTRTHRNVSPPPRRTLLRRSCSQCDKCLACGSNFNPSADWSIFLLVPLCKWGNYGLRGQLNAPRLLNLAARTLLGFRRTDDAAELTVHGRRKVDNQSKIPKLRLSGVASNRSPALMQVIESLFGVPVLQTWDD